MESKILEEISMTSIYDQNLDQNLANYQALSPIPFLQRSAEVFPEHPAIVYGDTTTTYAEFYSRCRQFAAVLTDAGVGRGDTVSVILANTPAMLEVHYAVPMCGAVLHCINTRLDAKTIAFQLQHSESKVLIADTEFSERVEEALPLLDKAPWVIDHVDRAILQSGNKLPESDYHQLVASGDPEFTWLMPSNEWDAISLNYTSGTTGDPKGVVYHHRGAYLLAQGNALTGSIDKHAVYLWTLPMFHCNGWCFPWTISAVCGTHVCLREVRGDCIWRAVADHRVTHFSGAPVVMSTIIESAKQWKHKLDRVVEFFTAAAPPPEATLAKMHALGFKVTHLYGLTEVYGPAVINDWNLQWENLAADEKAALKARQGVRYHALEGLEVFDPSTMLAVPRDGKTMGEVMFRGNVVMKGYLKNKLATEEAFAGGWFHSGDLAVIHADGYIQLKDRSKDIIISGGENISSIEIEDVLYKHALVSVAAVVAMPHPKWGETPCAFVEIEAGAKLTDNDLARWCQQHLARYKVPKHFELQPIIKTPTGKVQKFSLRAKAIKISEMLFDGL
jgi:fatty-acyl-CoA synthase